MQGQQLRWEIGLRLMQLHILACSESTGLTADRTYTGACGISTEGTGQYPCVK